MNETHVLLVEPMMSLMLVIVSLSSPSQLHPHPPPYTYKLKKKKKKLEPAVYKFQLLTSKPINSIF